MDSLRAIGSSLPALQVRSLANRDVESVLYAPEISPTEPNPTSPLASAERGDPAADRQRMLHFISHIDAECFISLLQTVDPMPDDYQARAAYKRFYHQLRESLEVPLPSEDPHPACLPTA